MSIKVKLEKYCFMAYSKRYDFSFDFLLLREERLSNAESKRKITGNF